MKPLISIIVPIYKVEPYLKRCIDSILKQTFTSFELILVDDGSPDRCPQICDEYAEKDHRIKVIHKENGGLSSARNAGINIARGEYLGFVDSDDWILPNMYETLLLLIKKYQADMAVCEYELVDEIATSLKNMEMELEINVFNNIEALEQIYGEINVKMVIACNKLYKKSLFDQINYPEGKIHEDEYIIHELLYKVNRVVYTNEILYAYVQRENSIMGRAFGLAHYDIIEAFLNRIEFFRQKDLLELESLAQKNALQYMIDFYYNEKVHTRDSGKILQKLENQISLLYRECNQKKILNGILKRNAILFKFSPIFFIILRRMKKSLKQFLFTS